MTPGEHAQDNTGQITRREFLRDAGLLVGGAAIAPAVMGQGCARPDSTGVTVGVTSTATVTVTADGGGRPQSGYVTLNINNRQYHALVRANWTLDFVLRDRLGLFGTKVGCGLGECGSCTVLYNGTPVLSCLTLAIEAGGAAIETVDGLSSGLTLDPLQQRFYEMEAFQCGFCTPGFLMAAKGLLGANPSPSVDEVREAFAGHICTCGNLARTIQAVAGGM